MFLVINKMLFVLIGIIFALLLTVRTFCNFKNNKILPVFVSFIAAALVLYVVSALLSVFLLPNISDKIIMLLFAASPFIIGKLVTYPKLKFYSIVQILSIIISIAYIYVLI